MTKHTTWFFLDVNYILVLVSFATSLGCSKEVAPPTLPVEVNSFAGASTFCHTRVLGSNAFFLFTPFNLPSVEDETCYTKKIYIDQCAKVLDVK